nr:MAG TPA: hypothetical protein [Caudoviricetes sp.]
MALITFNTCIIGMPSSSFLLKILIMFIQSPLLLFINLL